MSDYTNPSFVAGKEAGRALQVEADFRRRFRDIDSSIQETGRELKRLSYDVRRLSDQDSWSARTAKDEEIQKERLFTKREKLAAIAATLVVAFHAEITGLLRPLF